MARITRMKGVSSTQAGPYVKIAYHFTRRSIAKLTGRETQRMIEPLQMYAHVPVLLKGYASSKRQPPSCTVSASGSTPSPS